MLDARPPRRLILAYLIVALAAVALVGAVIGNKPMLGFGGVFAYLFAIIHGISFMVRARKRRSPAQLDRTERIVLASALGTMAAAAIGNLVTVTLILQDHPTVSRAPLASVSVWMVLTGVLCWRAWIVPSARRAAVMQLIAVMFALPSIFGPIMDATNPRRALVPLDVADKATLTATMFIGFAVVCCVGPVLDKLFAGAPDKDPHEVVPEAIVRG